MGTQETHENKKSRKSTILKWGKWSLLIGVIMLVAVFVIAYGDDLGIWETSRSLVVGTISAFMTLCGGTIFLAGIVLLIVGMLTRN